MSNKGPDLQAENLIECILKRKGGTVVNFGFHKNRLVVYHFKPLDQTDPESPHVCNVENAEHYERFVNIPEAYREYFPDEEYMPAMQVPTPTESTDPFDPRNDFKDLLSVNPDDVSNDWLAKFSTVILDIKPTAKQKLADYLKTTYPTLEFDYQTTTASEITRLILVQRIEEERNASEAAGNDE